MNKLRWRLLGVFEKRIFYLTLLFLPVNLAKHFFFDFVYFEGVLVDYLIPTVYLTDILVWGLLGFWLFRGVRGFRGIRRYRGNFFMLYSSFFILASGLSVLFAHNQPAAVYKWLKLLEYMLFALYVSKHVDFKKDWPTIVKLLSVGVLLEAVLATAQWFHQGSLFGYWFFGENRYTVATPGIAILDFTGVRKARPYGTFPHPNVLGGYLAIVLPWVFYLGLKGVRGIKGINERRFYFLTLGLGLAALYLSFSRSAWVVGSLGLLVTLMLIVRPRFSILNSSFLILNSLSFLRRAELNWISLQMIKDHPFFGVGLNNFTMRMDEYGRVSGWTRFLQPVHNIYLLIAAEIGLLGLLIFLGLLFSAFRLLLKNRSYWLLISLVQLALLGLTDHYLWTIQQGSLLFWLILGLALSQRFSRSSRTVISA